MMHGQKNIKLQVILTVVFRVLPHSSKAKSATGDDRFFVHSFQSLFTNHSTTRCYAV